MIFDNSLYRLKLIKYLLRIVPPVIIKLYEYKCANKIMLIKKVLFEIEYHVAKMNFIINFSIIFQTKIRKYFNI